MRASWNGYVRMGDLILPVRLYSAIRAVTPHFVRLHARDHSPITYVVKCQKDGEELKSEDIIRAVEIGGRYIEVSETDLQKSGLAEKNITVRQFSEPETINPMYYDKPYYIVPGKGGELAYTILRQAFVKSHKVAVVTYVLYEKEHLGIIHAHEGILILQQLRFAEQVVPRGEIQTPTLPQPAPAHIDTAAKLMERYDSSFYIEDYRNEQLDMLNELIDRKAKSLPPKKQQQIAPKTTPEEDVVPTLRSLLADKQAELHEV